MKTPDYYDIFTINGIYLEKKVIQEMPDEELEIIAKDVFKELRANGFNFTYDKKYLKEYDNLLKLNFDTTVNEYRVVNSACSIMCKIYNKRDYYAATSPLNSHKPSLYDAFHNDELLLKCIRNRLSITRKTKEYYNIAFANLMKGFNSSSICQSVSIFNPALAKLIYMKYSNENDTVYDYSAGWGGRMLGAASCNRKYIGTDPLTTDSLSILKKDLNLQNIELIKGESEKVKLNENSIDFSFSSPPYFNLEVYSKDISQAYNKGEEYFYNIYWNNTLKNVKFMLKPGKYFGLNVSDKYTKMVDMAKSHFGDIKEQFKFYTAVKPTNSVKKETKKQNKFEYVYMFKNDK